MSYCKYSGRVAEWKGLYGWITPDQSIDHPAARKHQGRLYVSKTDLLDTSRPMPGDFCRFYVFKDASGLGAEEVSIEDDR